MASFCIPKSIAKQLKEAASRGEIDMKKLYGLSSTERRATFEKYTNKQVAKQINLQFEKAVASQQRNALTKWAKETFVGSESKTRYKEGTLEKIDRLRELGMLSNNSTAFYEDLVSDAMGLSLTREEASKIGQLTEDLQKLSQTPNKELGTPSLEYWQKRREIDNYLLSINPASQRKIFVSSIGRAMMLASPKSAFLNIESNIIQGIMQGFERRAGSKTFRGILDRQDTKSFRKHALSVYRKTGYDITRMMDIGDDFKVRGEEITHTQGKGAVRRVGRVTDEVVFKYLMGYPDVVSSVYAFEGSANTNIKRMLKEKGYKGQEAKEKALELFKDAIKISPNTEDGRLVRAMAIADAQLATWTNSTWAGKFSMALRNAVNQLPGDLNLGDVIMPFVKTPANIVALSIDASGIGFVRSFSYLVSAKKTGDKAQLREAIRIGVRTFGAISVALILASLFDPDDFIGAFPTTEKERELLRTKNATPNSIRINGRWISLDYFGLFGSPLLGFMYARKYGTDKKSMTTQYVRGVGQTAWNIPGIEGLYNSFDWLKKFISGQKGEDDVQQSFENLIADFLLSRTIPAFVSDIAKSIDTVERDVDYKDVKQVAKSKLPLLRHTLPSKKDVFGGVINVEPAWSIILFGARVKSDRNTKYINELDRLDKNGYLPSITAPSKTSPRMKGLKTQIGEDKYRDAVSYYYQSFKDGTQKLMDSSKYGKMSDEDKKKAIESVKSDALESTLKKYGYKK